MSLRAMLWALYDAPTDTLAPGAFRVLLVLADHAGDDGCGAFPAAQTVADKLGITRRTVLRHLAALHEHGLIERGDQRLVDHVPGNRRPTVWNLCVAPRGDRTVTPTGVTPAVTSSRPGVTETAPRGDRNRRPGVTAAVTQNRPRNQEPTRARGRATSPLCDTCGFEHDARHDPCRPAVPMPAAIRELIHAAPVRTP